MFEIECLLITRIQPTLSEALENVDNEIQIGGTTEEYSTCNIASFTNKENNSLEYSYLAANDSQKKICTSQNLARPLQQWNFNEKERDSVSSSKHQVLVGVKNLLKQRSVDANAPVIECMKIFHHRNWTSRRTYGIDQLVLLDHPFSEPLSEKPLT